MIESFGEDYASAIIQVGKVELTLQFPRQVLAFHNLCRVGDRFTYQPNPKREVINVSNIKPVERANEPVNLPGNFLESLVTGSNEL